MKNQTLGFIFNPDFSKVLLIEKQRPDWQKGRLNGIGGKTEPGEEGVACIIREVREETGLCTEKDKWVHIGNMESPNWIVDIYSTVHHGEPHEAATITDEKIEWFDTKNIPENTLNNLHWLIPLAIDKLKHGQFQTCSVRY